ncbi:CDP-glycerol glycerophosphotransferase family protein [Enterococcus thailandicus]|uniref:CDP-glycerol glycerophosphotransferase family protein n=1 Tax=Enterococcus TaxID=1350 RepID=UPI00398473EE
MKIKKKIKYYREVLSFFGNPVMENMTNKRVKQNSIYLKELKKKTIKKNNVLLESYHAVSLTGNVYALYQELRKREEYSMYWVYKDKNDPMIDQIKQTDKKVKFVKYESNKYYKLLASCEYLINDTSFMPYFIKQEGQIYINTWHGTPLKTLGLDIKDAGFSDHKNIQRNLLHVDYLLMPNEFTADKLINSHDLKGIFPGKVFVTGNPRVDMIFKEKKELLVKYNLPKDQKIMLYAPTWKKDIDSTTDEDIKELINELDKLQDAVGEEYKVLLKTHYFIYDLFVEKGYANKILPNWIDTNELLACVDRLITDYSSIFFDFLPLKKPIYFYIPDKKTYDKKRGFYLDIDNLPGEVSMDFDSLCSSLKVPEKKYLKKYSSKIHRYIQNFCYLDNGDSSKRAIEVLFNSNSSNVKQLNYSSEKKVILLYPGGFYNNGITNSIINLSHRIDYSRYELVLLDFANINTEKKENMKRLHPKVHFIYKFSYVNRSILDTINQNILYRQGYSSKYLDKERIQSTLNYELKRIIGNLQPDIGVDFGGYNKMFNALIGLSNINQKTVYLHNTMKNEYEKKIGKKFKHKWNLKVIFSLYDKYNRIISVSESANEQNILDLSQYVKDISKMKYVNNIINDTEILNQLQQTSKIADGKVIISEIDQKERVPFKEESTDYGVIKIKSIVPPDKLKINFVNVARISPEKNHLGLISAFSKLCEDYDNCVLHILGAGPIEKQVYKLIIKLGLSDKVFLHGFVENPMFFVSKCDCFILPSNYEGQGLSLIESMILKVPVIGTDVPGIRSVINSKERGLLINNTVEDIYMAMKKYIEHPFEKPIFNSEEYNDEAMASFYKYVCNE